MDKNPLALAIETLGLQPLARACGVTYQAVKKWQARGRLPRTEWTGETDYAQRISAACAERGTTIPADALLAMRDREAARHKEAA